MKKKFLRFAVLTTAAVLAAVATFGPPTYRGEVKERQLTAVGDPALLSYRYETWKRRLRKDDGREYSTLSLVSPRSHSATRSGLHGEVYFDFAAGRVSAEVYGLSDEPPLELWLTSSARLFSASDGDASLRRIGSFRHSEQGARLEESMASLLEEGFGIEQVIVAPAGSDPLRTALLMASPSLFQRLYAAEQGTTSGGYAAPSLFRVAVARDATGFPDVFDDLVAQGENLFFNETFDGNGRTCGTCHPATNNFTIDADFIADLPPKDPLFVAEFVPELMFGHLENLDEDGNPRRFENPALMRAFGLIVENVDGMGDLENRFAMRSVPHNIGMTVSIQAAAGDLTPPDHRTGWSGEGAPSGVIGGIPVSGRLRDFAVGAVVQHFPKTMERSFEGSEPDFRPPTIEELDAIEAFMLSLGRQFELELEDGFDNTLLLKDPDAEAGKILFRDGIPPDGSFTCNSCHANAGANNLAGENRNFNTGVELFLQNRLHDPEFTVIGQPRPVDGGFGTNPAGDFSSLEEQPSFVNENFGNGSFNTTSLVEAADTPPFFHNNIIANLEDSIRFYDSAEFKDPDGDGVDNRNGIPFNDTEVMQVAAFLRVINAIDNVENFALPASHRAMQALELRPRNQRSRRGDRSRRQMRRQYDRDAVIHRSLQIGMADIEDAIQVLNEGDLHNRGRLSFNAVKQLGAAKDCFRRAMSTRARDRDRIRDLFRAQAHLERALDLMRF